MKNNSPDSNYAPQPTPYKEYMGLAAELSNLGRTARERGLVPRHGKFLGPVVEVGITDPKEQHAQAGEGPRPLEQSRKADLIIAALPEQRGPDAGIVTARLVEQSSGEYADGVRGSLGVVQFDARNGKVIGSTRDVTGKNREAVTQTFDRVLGETKGGAPASDDTLQALGSLAGSATRFAVAQPSGRVETYPLADLVPPAEAPNQTPPRPQA